MSTSPSYETIVFFGDSWTDNGNVQDLWIESFGFSPLHPAIYPEGRFSDGFKHADYLADWLGLEHSQVENYAIGGARALTDRTYGEVVADFGFPLPPGASNADFGVDLSAQIDRFLATVDGDTDLSDTAVSLLIGGNDFVGIDFADEPGVNLEAQSAEYGSELVDEVLAQATRLADAGAGTVFIYTVPDFSILPYTAGFSENHRLALDLASDAFNAELQARVDEFEALGVEVELFDFGAMVEEIASDYTTFGFRTFENPMSLDTVTFNPAVEGVPADQIALTDTIHTSDAAEQILARLQVETLTSEVQFGGEAPEILRGGRSDDLIIARDGDDNIRLGRGDDVGFGGQGDDIIRAGTGDDIVSGGSGNDVLKAGRGDDIIADNHGDDVSYGGKGDDILIDGAGSDAAFGGQGADVFIFTDLVLMGGDSSGDANIFRGGQGDDTLILRLEAEAAEQFNNGDLTLGNLGIEAHGIESVVAVAGLDLPEELVSGELFTEADQWGLV